MTRKINIEVGPRDQTATWITDSLGRKLGFVGRLKATDPHEVFCVAGVTNEDYALSRDDLKQIVEVMQLPMSERLAEHHNLRPSKQPDVDLSDYFAVAPLPNEGCDPSVLFIQDRKVIINARKNEIEVFCPCCKERLAVSTNAGVAPISLEETEEQI
jgi:hypothetical protein